MKPVDYLLVAIVVLIASAIVFFMIRSKKKGKKCIGCPDSGSCGKEPCSGGCAGCSDHGNCKNYQ